MQYILLLLCIFELICVPAVFLKLSLTAVTVAYVAVVLMITIALMCRKTVLKGKPENGKLGNSKFRLGKKLNYHHLRESVVNIAPSPILIVAGLLIIYQLFLVLAYQHNDADDAWYIGTAVTANETNALFQFSSYSGLEWDMIAARDYILSPFPILLAMLSKLLGIHPAILAHNVYPVLMIIWAYSVYYLLAKRLFEKKRNREYFLLFISVLFLFGYYSTRTIGTFLLFRSWQGKTTFCAIMVPLLFYYFLELLHLPADFVKQKKWYLQTYCIGFLLTNLAATLTSFSAVTFMPLLTGALALTYAVYKKALRVPIVMCLTCIPNVILVAIYMFAF